MHSKRILPSIMLLLFVGMVAECLANEARITMPAGVVNEPYSKSIATVLNESYGLSKPFTDWKLIGPAPVGFDLDSEGILYGTSTTSETHLFRVQALDRSEKRPRARRFLISLQIKPPDTDSSSNQSAVQRPTQSNPSPSPSPPAHAQVQANSSSQLQLKHAGMVSDKEEKTRVGIVVGPKVKKISIDAFEKADDGKFTKRLEEIKAPPLMRENEDYWVFVPLSKTGGTKVTVKDLTDKSTLETSIEINKLAASDEKEGDKDSKDSTTSDAKKIVIEKPPNKSDILPTDGSVDTYVKVAKKSGIKKIRYIVRNGANFYTDEVTVNPTEAKDDEVSFRVRVLEGTNAIRVADSNDETTFAQIEYNCKVDCASSFKKAEFAGSQNSRAVVGFEQAGASSASSETKPFIDFFFSTPIFFKRCGKKPNYRVPLTEEQQLEITRYENCISKRAPRIAVWGNVRLGATPDQIAAIGVLPTNFANTFGDPSNTVDLVQSFDFLTGLEYRVFTANGHFLSLIPGLPQKTRFYVAGGWGAISPLNPRRELAQIFRIPAENTPQFDDFIDRFGKPEPSDPAKEFVGLVPLERDRFLRQWYAGLRLKTFYCRNDECDDYENSFPSMVDVMFGQNEAVTGGSLFYLRPDPNDPNKTIKKKSFVLRFDAFYPFPLQRANFLYFYGTAIMKIGAGGVQIQNPLFLDRPGDEVEITDPRVYIPSPDRQKLFQPSRDYYKLGMGIDLIGLINRVTKKD